MRLVLTWGSLVLGGALFAQGTAVPIPSAAGQYRGKDVKPLVAVGAGVVHVGNCFDARSANGLDHARSTDLGRTWTGTNLFPAAPEQQSYELVASGSMVYAVRTAVSGVRCRVSTDAGATWLPPVTVPSVLVSSNFDVRSLVVASGQTVVVLSDKGSVGDMLCSRSLDGGATWSPSANLPGHLGGTFLTISGNRVHMAGPNGTSGSCVRTSSNQGLTWSGCSGFAGTPTDLRIVGLRSTGNVVLAFATVNNTLLLDRSTDGGTTWQPAPTVIGPADAASHVHDGASSDFVAAAAQGVITVWESSDDGQTWTSHPAPLQGTPTLVWDAGTLALVAEDHTTATPTSTSIVVSAVVSTDRGASWSGAGSLTAQSGNPPPYSTSYRYRMGADLSGGVFVLHVDDGHCDNFGYCTWDYIEVLLTADAGATWFSRRLGQVGRLQTARVGDSLSMIVGDEALFASTLSGTLLTASMLFGYQPYGSAKPGTGNVAPELTGTGAPVLGATVQWTVRGAVGGSLTALAMTLGGPASTPFGSGSLLLQTPLVTSFAVTSGAAGAPGAGSASWSQAIPPLPVFRGRCENCQAFVLDAGAADGFSSTAGVEMWVQ